MPWERLERDLVLPEPFRRRFEQDAPYFVIWLANQQVLRTTPTPSPVPPLDPSREPRPRSALYSIRQRGDLRELIIPGPAHTHILVGRSIRREQAGLHRLTWQLLSTGCAVLLVGLAGGWLLSRGVVQPIENMSKTAAAISADNLSQRIDLTEVDSELGRLGQILNAMFARLEAAFARQIQFTADASHELRTPLAVLQTNVELALARPRSAEDYRVTLETCLRAARRMKGLVEGLLTLARADAGKLNLERAPVDLAALVEDSLALVSPLAEAASIRLSHSVVPVEVIGDAARLAQVLTNLLSNAIHYNRPEGEVAVQLQACKGMAVLSVRDTGFGIPEADRPHLFERFYRVDRARSRERGGSGLGLSICKSIVEAHGGTISFTSEVDQGTTFVVCLPGALAEIS